MELRDRPPSTPPDVATESGFVRALLDLTECEVGLGAQESPHSVAIEAVVLEAKPQRACAVTNGKR